MLSPPILVKNEIQFLKEVIKAQDKLLVCYRLGGRPPEWVFDKLTKAREIYGDLQEMAHLTNQSTRPDDSCPKGGEHEWGIDGAHSNEFCKKCFISPGG